MSRDTVSMMPSNPRDDAFEKSDRTARFWLHLTDNLFRRFLLYLLPVALMLGAGIFLAQRSEAEFSSTATLDASDNPLVEELDVRGDDPLFRQTKADSTATFMSERLRTDAFSSEVAIAAGLGEALDAGRITNTTIREQISVRANGDSIIIVEGTWSDAATAQNLTRATIDTYRNYVIDTVTADGTAAAAFFGELLSRAIEERDDAADALNNYVESLGDVADGEQRPVEELVNIERLANALERAEASVETATNEIERAQLEVAKSRSEAGESVRLIDPPELPLAPEPRLVALVGLVVMFLLLGFLVSATALVITTAFDNTVRFGLDAQHHTGVPYVASVSSVPEMSDPTRRRSKRKLKRSQRGTAASNRDDGNEQDSDLVRARIAEIKGDREIDDSPSKDDADRGRLSAADDDANSDDTKSRQRRRVPRFVDTRN